MLMSFPPGTEMFQFPGFASAAYGFSGGSPLREGLPHSEILGSQPARGSPRLFAACHVLHRLLAPRHPPDALAFLGPHQRQPHHNPTRSTTRRGPRRERTGLTKKQEDAAAAAGNHSSVNCKLQVLADCWPKPTSGKHTHAKHAPCRRRKKRAGTHDLPAPAVPRRMAGSLLPCPHDGHLVTTSRCPRNTRHRPGPTGPAARERGTSLRAAGPGPGHDGRTSPKGKRGLVGLGRLERPTSRLSGVRSNQLSYRPERHPAGPGTRAARAGRCPNLVTAGPHGPTVVCEGTCRRRRAILPQAMSEHRR